MNTNLQFKIFLHTKNEQQTVDQEVKNKILSLTKGFRPTGYLTLKVTKNQEQLGALYFTKINVDVDSVQGAFGFDIVRKVGEMFTDAVSVSLLIENLYVE